MNKSLCVKLDETKPLVLTCKKDLEKFIFIYRRSTAGALDPESMELEAPAREKVPAQEEDWKEPLPSPLNGKR